MEHMDVEVVDENLNGIGSDIVRRFLDAYATPDHIGLFVRANQLLARYRVEFVERETENVIAYGAKGNSEKSDILDELEGLYDTTLRVWLQQLRIKVSKETMFKELVPLCEAIEDLWHYEDSAQVLRFLDSGNDTIGRLVQALGLVVGDAKYRFFSDLVHVDLETIELLREAHAEEAEAQEQVEDVKTIQENQIEQRRIKNVRNFLATLGRTDLVFANAIVNNLVIGLPFMSYIRFYQDSFVTLTDEQIAMELAGFFLISDADDQDMLRTITPAFEQILDSEQRAQQIRMLIPRLLAAIKKPQ